MTNVHENRGRRRTTEGGWPRMPLVLCGVLASALCVLAWRWRCTLVGRPALAFLTWNLFLAWVPLALTATRALSNWGLTGLKVGRPWRRLLLWPLDLAWLLFLPNAPYLVTDLVHLADRPPVSYWFDLLMFCGFASTGCWLGVVSFESVLSRFESGLAKTALAAVTSLACGYGVYLGRIDRLNSWDALDAPIALLAPLTRPGALAFSLAFAVFFGLLLWAFRVAAGATNVSTGDS